jgi:hypothetical protein
MAGGGKHSPTDGSEALAVAKDDLVSHGFALTPLSGYGEAGLVWMVDPTTVEMFVQDGDIVLSGVCS